MQSSGFLCDAALAAGHELSVFETLRRVGPTTLEQLAMEIGAAAGQRRLRALLDVLVALGAVRRRALSGADAAAPRLAANDAVAAPPSRAGGETGAGGAISVAAKGVVVSRSRAGAETGVDRAIFVPADVEVPRPVVARAGWGLLAEVIREDRPLPAEEGADAVRRLHEHLARAGAAAAQELLASLGDTSLLDLGAGAGAYSQAFLAAHPGGRATLVDRREVLALAAEWLGPLAGRARFVEGDAAEVDPGVGYRAALIANLLHLHSDDMCARLCAAATRAVAPGGVVVIKDLRVDDDRSGPIEGLLFALNMALYTEAGDVYSTSQLRAWLDDAGLVDIAELRLAAAPDAIVVVGRRSAEP